MCGHDHIIVGGDLGRVIASAVETASPRRYKITHVTDNEAANCVFINGTLIRRTRDEFPMSADALDAIGGKQLAVTASELAKVDGALSCCSVLF
jgi:dimethylargininase